ncbi:DUF885 domain-containing protein [Shewanella sp. 202IG2-18]|uniref:DUF885 domain-containing protein n=1 Tax=Parashewanella hymeniacidonis TaxID=2807618 RepID=UPI0019600B22|nr:DUF885 domain-containing protein [Parashewanella hymeniacidonis]MBM7074317.1 DUF885 domain-containing protein [Parashewanella hymeniacidonis]
MKKLILSILVASTLCGCSINIHAPVQTSKNSEDQNIKAERQSVLAPLIEQDWQIKQFASAQLAASTGDKSQLGKLDNLSPEHLEDVYHQKLGLLEQLSALDDSVLTKDERINKQILKYQLQNSVDMYRFHDHYQPITAESGFHAYIASISKGRFNTEQDYRNYLNKLAALPKYFKQQTYWLTQGVKAGITPPKVTLNGFEDSISAFIVPVEQSGYFAPFNHFPDHFSAELKQELISKGRDLVKNQVLTSYQNFYDFMTLEYIPNARTDIAATSLPDGKDFYENRVQYYTTLPMTSEEVHQLGLKEVARIRAEMRQVIKQTQFKGSFAEFLHFLRTDPQFYPKTAEELLKEASYIAKQADAMLPKYFGKLPRMPYGIAPVPAQIAPKYTTGRYSGSTRDDKAGYYWVNTYALDKRPLYELTALTLHEAIPGHHLQISLNKELDNLPNFRRFSYISAFGEGWGLYSEYLGLEAGLYKDPYSNFGRLTYEMWRATRLVVDTGMHAQNWTRQQAINYMAENSALSLHNITTEVDRYISWPGQALSYKIGELTIKRLRKKAEAELGEKFDIRAFHDAVLANGSVPMSILEQQIDTFIETQK